MKRTSWAGSLTALTLGLVLAAPGAATADDTNPVGELVTQLSDTVAPQSTTEPAPSLDLGTAIPSQPAPAPSSDDDSEGHETTDPVTPDHGQAQVADVNLADEDVADLADSSSTVNDDDSTNGDTTLLALGGEEIIGAHAESGGTEEAHAGDPLAPLCEGTEGGVCLRILYADAYATESGGESTSKSESGLADACVGGTNTDPAAECDGVVAAGAGQSESTAHRDQASGQTTADSSSSTADAGVGPSDEVSAGVLQSEGWADSGNSPGSADRSSTVADLELAGTPVADVSDPQALAVPPGCTSPSVVCVFANQGETYTGDGLAGHAQEALHVEALDGTLLTELATSETLVHNDGGETTTDGPGTDGPGTDGPDGPGTAGPDAAGPDADGPASGGQAADGVLPNTGGPMSALLGVAMMLLAAGAFLVARSRRLGSLAG